MMKRGNCQGLIVLCVCVHLVLVATFRLFCKDKVDNIMQEIIFIFHRFAIIVFELNLKPAHAYSYSDSTRTEPEDRTRILQAFLMKNEDIGHVIRPRYHSDDDILMKFAKSPLIHLQISTVGSDYIKKSFLSSHQEIPPVGSRKEHIRLEFCLRL